MLADVLKFYAQPCRVYSHLTPAMRREIQLTVALWATVAISLSAESTSNMGQNFWTFQNLVTVAAVVFATGVAMQSLKDVRVRLQDLEKKVDDLDERFVSKELFQALLHSSSRGEKR